jgi:hypothetical protein
MDKPIYRVTFLFTEEKYRKDPPVNLFLFADSEQDAVAKATQMFQEEMKAHNRHTATVKTETHRSSQEEVMDYARSMAQGHHTQELVN